MNKLTDYGIVIIDREGQRYNYKRELGHLHQEYLDEYSKLREYSTSNRVEISQGGDAFFYICDKKNFLGFLPKDASCKQQEKLEEVADEVEDLELLAIRKFMEVGYKDFNLRENIPDKYLHDVIGSYNNAKKLR